MGHEIVQGICDLVVLGVAEKGFGGFFLEGAGAEVEGG